MKKLNGMKKGVVRVFCAKQNASECLSAEACVEATSGAYLGFARKLTSPGWAASRVLTPIRVLAATRSDVPSILALSLSASSCTV
jgi:hypothetical protein